jgi:hypothetical protein
MVFYFQGRTPPFQAVGNPFINHPSANVQRSGTSALFLPALKCATANKRMRIR